MSDQVNYSALLSELKRKESELLHELAGVRAAIAGISKARTVTDPSNWISGSGDEAPYRNLSIKRASIEVLRLQGKPLGNTEIAKALAAGGYRSTSEQFHRTVFNVLKTASKKETSEIVKIDGGWALREWTEGKHASPVREKGTRRRFRFEQDSVS